MKMLTPMVHLAVGEECLERPVGVERAAKAEDSA